MKILFRTDASVEIGTGHVMRCLTLADALRKRGAETVFICRPHRGHLLAQIRERGHEVRVLSPPLSSYSAAGADTAHADWLGLGWYEDALETAQLVAGERVNWLVVDHYALDRRWQQKLRPACHQIMAIDDLADRVHDCDILLDPSLGRKEVDYHGLIPISANALLGPNFALLRPEFAALRADSLARRKTGAVQHLLITMGGVDKDNATGRVLEALSRCELPAALRVAVVMGPHAPWLGDVRERAAQMPVSTEILIAVDNMARLMAGSDLAIGAAGGTSWERCCMGLPTIQFVVATNQAGIARELAQIGAAVLADERTLPDIFAQMTDKARPERLKEQSRIASMVTDGLGVARVVDKLTGRKQ